MLMSREEEKCERCRFWCNRKRWIDENFKEQFDGECHRNPPITNGHLSYFPRTASNEWCGEFKETSPGDELGRKMERLGAILERKRQ